MSVDRTDYVIYGWKLPYKLVDDDGNNVDINSDKIEPYINVQSDGYILIQDWMGSSYTVFGKLILQSDSYGFEFKDLNSESNDIHEAQDKLKEILNITSERYPSLFIFTHSS